MNKYIFKALNQVKADAQKRIKIMMIADASQDTKVHKLQLLEQFITRLLPYNRKATTNAYPIFLKRWTMEMVGWKTPILLKWRLALIEKSVWIADEALIYRGKLQLLTMKAWLEVLVHMGIVDMISLRFTIPKRLKMWSKWKLNDEIADGLDEIKIWFRWYNNLPDNHGFDYHALLNSMTRFQDLM